MVRCAVLLVPPARAGDHVVDQGHPQADDAGPGDTVTVTAGVYREGVKPRQSGTAKRCGASPRRSGALRARPYGTSSSGQPQMQLPE